MEVADAPTPGGSSSGPSQSLPSSGTSSAQLLVRLRQLELNYQQRVAALKATYDERIHHLTHSLTRALTQVRDDSSINTMGNSESSQQFVKNRLVELLSGALSLEREQVVKSLMDKIALRRVEVQNLTQERDELKSIVAEYRKEQIRFKTMESENVRVDESFRLERERYLQTKASHDELTASHEQLRQAMHEQKEENERLALAVQELTRQVKVDRDKYTRHVTDLKNTHANEVSDLNREWELRTETVQRTNQRKFEEKQRDMMQRLEELDRAHSQKDGKHERDIQDTLRSVSGQFETRLQEITSAHAQHSKKLELQLNEKTHQLREQEREFEGRMTEMKRAAEDAERRLAQKMRLEAEEQHQSILSELQKAQNRENHLQQKLTLLERERLHLEETLAEHNRRFASKVGQERETAQSKVESALLASKARAQASHERVENLERLNRKYMADISDLREENLKLTGKLRDATKDLRRQLSEESYKLQQTSLHLEKSERDREELRAKYIKLGEEMEALMSTDEQQMRVTLAREKKKRDKLKDMLVEERKARNNDHRRMKAKIKSLDEQVLNLSRDVTALTSQRQEACEKLSLSLKTLRKVEGQHEKKEKVLLARIQDYENLVDDVRRRLVESNRIVDEKAHAITLLQQEAAVAQRTHEATVSGIKQDFATTLKDREADVKREIDTLKHKHELALSRLSNEHQKVLDAQQAKYQQTLTESNQEWTDRVEGEFVDKKQHERLVTLSAKEVENAWRSKYDALHLQWESRLNDRTSQLEEKAKAALDKQESEATLAREQTQRAHEDAVRDLTLQWSQKLKETEHHHREQMTNTLAQVKLSAQKLEAQLTRERDARGRMQDEVSRLTQLKNELKSTVAALTASLSDEKAAKAALVDHLEEAGRNLGRLKSMLDAERRKGGALLQDSEGSIAKVSTLSARVRELQSALKRKEDECNSFEQKAVRCECDMKSAVAEATRSRADAEKATLAQKAAESKLAVLTQELNNRLHANVSQDQATKLEQARIQQHVAQQDRLKTMVAERDEALRTLESQMQAERQRFDRDQEKTASQWQEHRMTLVGQLEQLQAKLDESTQRAESMRVESVAALGDLQKKLELSEQENAGKSEEIARLGQSLSEMNEVKQALALLQDKHNSVSTAHTEAEGRLAESQERLSSATVELARAQADAEGVRRELQGLSNRFDNQTQQLSTVQSQYEKLHAEYQASLRDKSTQLQRARDSWSRRDTRQQALVAQLTRRVAETVRRYRTQQQHLKNLLATEWQALQNFVSTSMHQLVQQHARVVRDTKQEGLAQVQRVESEDREHLEKVLAQWKEEANATAQRLMGEKSSLEQALSAAESAAQTQSQRALTLEAKLADQRVSHEHLVQEIKVGHAAELGKTQALYESQKQAAVRQAAEEFAAQRAELAAQVERAQMERTRVETAHASVTAQLADLKASLNSERGLVSQHSSELSAAHEQLRVTRARLKEVETDLKVATGQLTAQLSSASASGQRVTAAETRVVDLVNTINTYIPLPKDLSTSLSSMDSDNSTPGSPTSLSGSGLVRLGSLLQERLRLAEKDGYERGMTEGRNALSGDLESVSGELKNQSTINDELRQSEDSLKQQLSTTQDQLRRSTSALRAARDELEKHKQRAVVQVELARVEAEKPYKDEIKQLWNSMSDIEAKHKSRLADVEKSWQARLTAQKRHLEELHEMETRSAARRQSLLSASRQSLSRSAAVLGASPAPGANISVGPGGMTRGDLLTPRVPTQGLNVSTLSADVGAGELNNLAGAGRELAFSVREAALVLAERKKAQERESADAQKRFRDNQESLRALASKMERAFGDIDGDSGTAGGSGGNGGSMSADTLSSVDGATLDDSASSGTP